MMIDFALAEAERKGGKVSARCNLPGLPAALPPDHDDHHGGDAGHGLPLALGPPGGTGAELRKPLGVSIRRWTDFQPGAYALHGTSRLSLHWIDAAPQAWARGKTTIRQPAATPSAHGCARFPRVPFLILNEPRNDARPSGISGFDVELLQTWRASTVLSGYFAGWDDRRRIIAAVRRAEYTLHRARTG